MALARGAISGWTSELLAALVDLGAKERTAATAVPASLDRRRFAGSKDLYRNYIVITTGAWSLVPKSACTTHVWARSATPGEARM